MPNTLDIKRRQRSVKNTKQVTLAMQMVAASKMRKSQTVALRSRPFAQNSMSLLSSIKTRSPGLRNKFLNNKSRTKKILVMVVTSDKGLCGGLNSSVIRECKSFFAEYQKGGYTIELILVGSKSRALFEKTGLKIHNVFKGVGDYVDMSDIKPISRAIQGAYINSRADKVIAIYTEFISTLKQKVRRRQILPVTESIFSDLVDDIKPSVGKFTEITDKGTAKKSAPGDYIFEPSAKQILKTLVPFLIDIYVYHIILESNASEHSARMVAMKNASDSADKILKELTLSYNKARQANITKELAEITAGSEALR